LTSATVALGTNTVAETYLYDLNGALTNRYSEIGGQRSEVGEQQFEYDCAGRMTFASTGNATLSVTYDALGNRLTTYAANTTRLWITDHADPRKRPLMETDSNGTPVRYFIWGGGMLLALVEADGTIRYCHSDEQGSVVALTDASGAVTDQYCYGPYGTDWGHSGTNSIPFRWLGSHGVFNVDGSSLYLTRCRAYDSSLIRFLSQDPLGLGGGPNLYAYCLGSPLAYIDPLGLGAESSTFYPVNYVDGLPSGWLPYYWTDNQWLQFVPLISNIAPLLINTAGDLFHFGVDTFSLNPMGDSTPYLAATFMFAPEIQMVQSTSSGLTAADWVRTGKTVVPNQVIYGAGERGATVTWAIKGGGGRLPFHYHIHEYNWYKPWSWFTQTPILR